MSDSLWPHGLQHARLPYPSLSSRVCSNSCPLSWLCHPTILSCHPLLLPWMFPSIRVFSNESVLCIRWPKYWDFSFSISPSNEYSRFISFRIDWFDLLAVQGILKSLFQHHISKASIRQCSAFLMVKLSHLYMTTGKKPQLRLYGPLATKWRLCFLIRFLDLSWAFLVTQLVSNLPAMWETWIRSLGWEDPLEKGKATHSSILAWRIPWTVQSMGSQRVGHDWVTFTSLHF